MNSFRASYVSASDKFLGFRESFLGVEGHFASLKEKARVNMAYADVASKGLKSLGRVQAMSEIAEKARIKDGAAPVAPSPEQLAQAEAGYSARSIKELREICKARPKNPYQPDAGLG